MSIRASKDTVMRGLSEPDAETAMHHQPGYPAPSPPGATAKTPAGVEGALGSGTMSAGGESLIQFSFMAEVIYWRGPSPFFFVSIPSPHAAELKQVARAVTYGWGVIPVEAKIGDVAFNTSLFPKDETYLLPLKTAVRRKTNITAGDSIFVEMTVQAVRR